MISSSSDFSIPCRLFVGLEAIWNPKAISNSIRLQPQTTQELWASQWSVFGLMKSFGQRQLTIDYHTRKKTSPWWAHKRERKENSNRRPIFLSQFVLAHPYFYNFLGASAMCERKEMEAMAITIASWLSFLNPSPRWGVAGHLLEETDKWPATGCPPQGVNLLCREGNSRRVSPSRSLTACHHFSFLKWLAVRCVVWLRVTRCVC